MACSLIKKHDCGSVECANERIHWLVLKMQVGRISTAEKKELGLD